MKLEKTGYSPSVLWVALPLLLFHASPSTALRGSTWSLRGTAAAAVPVEAEVAEPHHAYVTYYKKANNSKHDGNNLTTEFGCTKDPVFEDPWVKQNVVLTYAVRTKDGLGSQALRMMSVYAAAAALGLQYIHTPLHCIGHFGLTTYVNSSCDNVDQQLQEQMGRLSKFVSLPTAAETTVGPSTGHTIAGQWSKLALKAQQALAHKKPAIVRLEGAHVLAWTCPNLFNHVPAWRRSELSSSKGVNEMQHTGKHYWLLDRRNVVRIAVHHRRGDVAASGAEHAFRYLPVTYYLNVVKGVIKVLDSAQLDYTVEWYTEASASPAQHEDMARVRKEIPNLTLVFDSDIIWTWERMATADVLVLSLSAFGIVPAVVNRDGLIIRAPPSPVMCAANTASSQWLEPQHNGTLTTEIVQRLLMKFSVASGVPAAEHHSRSLLVS